MLSNLRLINILDIGKTERLKQLISILYYTHFVPLIIVFLEGTLHCIDTELNMLLFPSWMQEEAQSLVSKPFSNAANPLTIFHRLAVSILFR